MTKWGRKALRSFFLLVLTISTISWSQTSTSGAVVGTVVDSSGAVVAQVTIVLSDIASATKFNAQTNSSGQFAMLNVPPGRYRLAAEAHGFRTTTVQVTVEVAKSARVDLTLSVGSSDEFVDVSANAAAAELQTLESSVGDVIGGRDIVRMPTTQRNALELVYLQVGTVPATGVSSQYYGRGGSVAGARGDQSTTTIDGIDASERYTSAARGISSIDLPIDAIEEFRSTTANPNAQLGTTSSGGYYTFATRRGTDHFHGAAYWYGQNDALNANSWTRNRLGQKKPAIRDNRFGGRIGGPIFKGKTYFFGFYERRMLPQTADASRLVPTDTLRQGILRFQDSTRAIISYDLATSKVCGPARNAACDPRSIGISPLIKQYFSFYPKGNDPSLGDGLNTIGFHVPADATSQSDTAVLRLDQSLTSTWRLSGSAIYQRQRFADIGQLEMDTRVTNGNGFKTLGGSPRDPRHLVVAVTGQINSGLNNEFRAGWDRQDFGTQAVFAQPQVSGTNVPLQLGGLGNLGDPAPDVARPQYVKQRSWTFSDNLSWVKGSHLLQFGFSSVRQAFFNARPDRLPLSTVPAAQITAGSFVTIPAAQRPPTCTTSAPTNCLPSSQTSNWNTLYGAVLGVWDNTQMLVVRDPATGKPSGANFASANAISWHNEIFAMDTWRVNQSLTLNGGLKVVLETPWADEQQREYFIADASNNQLINPFQYLRQRESAAQQGNVYNANVEFLPRKTVGRTPYQNNFNVAPRVAASWSPSFQKGILGAVFGQRKSVLRGGYSLMFDRVLTTVMVTSQISSNELLNSSATILAPSCTLSNTPGPGCAAGVPFRVGVDGSAFNPTPVATVAVPFVPTARTATGSFGITSARAIDPNFKVGRVHGADITFQRELPGSTVVELGWIGRYGRQLPISFNLNAVPIHIVDMSHKSQQTFAHAFDAVATQLRQGTPAASVTPQPWFENTFGAGQTASIAAAASSQFIAGQLSTLFTNTIDKRLLSAGKPTVLNQQFDRMSWFSSGGWSNYDAFFATARKRMSHLTLNANWTWSHGLDTGSTAADASASAISNPYDIAFDYGDSVTDIRHVVKAYGTYELPFAPKNKRLGGWYTSFIFQARTGLPIPVSQGGQVFGSQAIFGSTTESAYSNGSANLSPGLYSGINGSGGVATSGNVAIGGTGLNLFKDPVAAFNSFRPFLLSQDTRSNRGLIRGLKFWTLDFSVGKETHIGERVSATLAFDFFNILNHPILRDPTLSLNTPSSFGVITSQLEGNPARADFSGPRRIQAGLRIDF